MKKVRLLIVDDSAVVRSILTRELAKDPEIEIVGTAPDPYVARDKIVQLAPDVITLDVEMPRMDGITFLEKIMEHHPLPVIILSSLTPAGCETTMRALSLGAIDVMQKPELDVANRLQEMILMLSEKIKAAAAAHYRFVRRPPTEKPQRDVLKMTSMIRTTDRIVAIGASTGGTEALRAIMPRLPADFPGVLIAQHMPEKFTKSFADSLNQSSPMEIREAQNNDTIHPGLVLIAPGNYHMVLRRSGARYYVEIKQGPLVCHQRPSVEVLFDSVALYAGKNAVGVMLTGMGSDGAQGMLRMKQAGARTIAQNEESCVVYGMPKEAVKAGAIDEIVHLDRIPEMMMKFLA